jgi:hypothetical protein
MFRDHLGYLSVDEREIFKWILNITEYGLD